MFSEKNHSLIYYQLQLHNQHLLLLVLESIQI